MTRTRLDDLKYNVFNNMPETVITEWGAASGVTQISDISQSIPHHRSFEHILAD